MLQCCMYALLGYDAVAHYGVELGSQTLPLGFLGADPGSISYSLWGDVGWVPQLCILVPALLKGNNKRTYLIEFLRI